MKRKIITCSLAVGLCFGLNAQDLVSKKGVNVLPEAGDMAIGADATPLLEYVGNAFNFNENNTVNSAFRTNDQSIFLKYFKDESTAIRGRVRLGFHNVSVNNLVLQDGQVDPTVTVEDNRTVRNSNVVLSGGLEKRRGNGRLQGFYGGELFVSLSSSSSTFEYGNAFASDNDRPTSTIDFDALVSGLAPSRRLEESTGSTFGVGLRGFVGAEYFFAPKMSVGTEFGWGFGFNSTGEGETKTEFWDSPNNTADENVTKTAGGSSLDLDTDNLGGAIFIMFHF